MQALSLEQALDCPSLPSLPTVAIQILELTARENVRLEEIAALVQHDPALTARVLRTVNSPYYGLAEPCPTIQRAITYLGLDTVKSLVLSFSLIDLSQQAEGAFDLVDFWRRCLYCAAVIRRIAAMSGTSDPDTAFTTALMQDIGMLALRAAAPTPYKFIMAHTARDHHRLPVVERNTFGFDHAEVGAALAERWNLPAQMVEAIRHHHDAQLAQHAALVYALALAYEITAAVTLPELSTPTGQVERLAHQWFKFNPEQVRQLKALAIDDTKELSALLRVDVGELPDINDILSRAEEAFIRHQAGVRRGAEALRVEKEHLAVLATTDALTQVGNRNRFRQVLTAALEAAQTSRQRVGLIMIDADRFKTVNDTLGHDAGDAVLVELAARLNDTKGPDDVVCRLGGEEFAIVVHNTTLREVTTLAECLRLAVSSRPFEIADRPESGEPLNMGVSVGAAVSDHEQGGELSTPASLVKAADTALYAAKQAGRDHMRMHSPDSEQAAA